MVTSKILVVDDEASVREMVSDALSLAGYEARTAVDGFDATQILKSEEFQLLVTDVNMPKIDGYELVERLRAKGNQIPVVFLTARSEKPDIARGFRTGADAVIAYKQPISRGQIASIRAVNVDSVVRTLHSRGLITELYTDSESGAIHYGTAPLLLEVLGINSIDELPLISPYLPDANSNFDAI